MSPQDYLWIAVGVVLFYPFVLYFLVRKGIIEMTDQYWTTVLLISLPSMIVSGVLVFVNLFESRTTEFTLIWAIVFLALSALMAVVSFAANLIAVIMAGGSIYLSRHPRKEQD